MKKERFKRRIRKITAFAAAVAMAVSITVPSEMIGNIDFGITVFAEESGYTKGFCDTYTEGTECSAHGADCNGYQPAILTTDKYNIDGVDGYDNVYEIGNAGQLYWFAALVNGTNGLTRNSSANAVLTADITVNTGDVANCGGTKQVGWKDWTPIGNYIAYYVSYEGTFDGQNHTISGLFFNNSSTNYVGLFGYNKGTIKNVGVVDSYFNGNKNVGGVCGSIRCGTITNCYNTGTVSGTNSVGGVYGNNDGGTITNCYNTGTVSGARFVGGVCGSNGESGCTLTNCYNTGKVSGNNNIGGVCGYNYYSKITNCYFNSTVYSGNAVGTNEGGTVSDNVLGKTTKQFKSGEVCYLLNGEKSVGTAKNPLAWYQNIDNGAKDDYPLLDSGHGTVYYGYDDSQNLKYSNSSLKAELNHDYTNNNGFCTGCGAYEPATLTTDKYDIDGDNRKDNVYEIGNAGQLYWFAALVNGDLKDGTTQNKGANAILTDNITINDNVLVNGELNSANEGSFRKWTPIGKDSSNAYTGTFDGKNNTNGQNYTISGLYYSEEFNTDDWFYAGLFGYSKGIISNITIENSYFYIKGNDGSIMFGAFIGQNEGEINNCKNTGIVNIDTVSVLFASVGGICGLSQKKVYNCNNSGRVIAELSDSSQCFFGGISGDNSQQGIIESCSNFGNVSVSSNSTYVYIGGISGDNFPYNNNRPQIKNCVNSGIIASTLSNGEDYIGGICGGNQAEITGCYNSGNVNGTKYVGGVCGGQMGLTYSSPNYGTITNCYNTGTVKGTSEVGGICGWNLYAGTIENCYSAGSVSGTSDTSNVGGVCGNNATSGSAPSDKKSTIRNCYFDNDKYSGDAVGDSDDSGILEKVEGKSSEDFSEGEVCYLLNNGTTNGSQVWYQTLDSEAYPNLDNTNKESRTVYACTPCTGVFSNTSGQTAEHTYTVDSENGKKHICKKCGDTHNAVFTAVDDTISVCCDLGSVTLTAPIEENLTYDGTEKAATVTGKIEGFDTPKIFYKEKNATGDATETAPVNAGTYIASITYTDEGSAEHTVSVEYTIKQKELTVEAGEYKVSKGYDGTKNPGTGSGEFKVTGLVTGDSVTINADSIGSYPSKNVGTEYNVDVEISLPYTSINYKLKNTKVTVPAEIYAKVITADDLEFFDSTFAKTYDGTTDSNAKARIKETVFGTAIEISGTAVYDSKDVNGATKVTFTPDNVTVGNYTLAPTETIEHLATITAKPITVTADNNSKTYGASDPTLTYTVDPATPLAEGDTLTGALDRTTGENVGTYDITQGTLTNENNPNYDITFNKGTFTISGAEISEIVITGITAPVKMVTLDTDADTSTTGCDLSAVSWTDGDTTAGFDKAYTAKVVVTADSNHSFGSSLTAKVNGETASVTKNADGTVTVTYTFEKTAAAAVTKIEMKTSPTKTEYFVGEDIDLTGATIIATYEDSTTSEPIPITAEMISGFDSSTAGTKTVTVEYESKTTTFNVTIKEPAVTGITISTTPKTEYLIDDSLDVTGGEITVSYEYGADKVIAITSGMVTGFDSSAAVESQTITVTYQEKTDTYTITVKKHTPTVTAPTASAITLGQTLADSTLSDSTWSWSDSSIQPTSAGTHSYTAVKTVNDANYYDYSALSGFTFNSSTNTLTTEVSVEVKRAAASVTPPTASNTLTYGQTLADAGLTEGWTWETASTVPDVNNTGYTAYKIVTDYDNFDYSNLTGFVYDETAHKLSCTVSVTVTPIAPTDATTVSQSFTKGTASTAFAAPVFKGVDNAVLTGSVSYTYDGQTYATTAALTAVLDTLDGGATGTIDYTFNPNSANYTTANGSISFEVIDAVVTGITLKSAPTKTTYEVGDTLDLTGGKITVSYNNNTSVDKDITEAMTSGFDSTTAGEKTVTVTYGGFSVTFKVTVSKGSFTVEPTPGNMEGAKIDMTEEALYDAVLTPEDKALIEQGVDIAVLMTVITINPSSVPANDVTAIANVMGDFELGCYIDVSLFKKYSNSNTEVPVTDTNSPITISFKVPADILAQYPVSEYEYSVFCSHNGVGYPITCTYNAATNVMSFSSTMFSTYALAVKSRTPAAVDYTITADSHVTVQATAQAGDIVSVTVEDGYKATVTNSLGTVITTITGTGSFVMPESNVTITSELINTHVHDYSTEWKTDSTSHWHECECGDRVNVAAHVSNSGIVTVRPTETTEGVRTYSCSICGYVMRTEPIPTLDPDHSHSYGAEWKSDSTSHWHECDCGEKVDIASHISDNGVVTLQPTETSEGIMTYSCSICGYILRTETIPANTPVHTHNYGTAWYYDSTCHWHECSCGDRSNIGQHISNGGIVTVQPTATSTGLRVYSCSVCGYVLRTETIPATGYNYPNYPTYPTYPTYPFDSSIFNVVTFTDKVNVTAETEGNTVTIKWDKVEKANKYYVYQYKNGKYVKVKTTSDTSATFKKLKNGETYKFLIRYTKSGRLSPTKYSGTISVKVYYKPIPKPTATKNSIKLTWEAVPEAEKYAIYKYVDGKAVKLTETKKLSVKIGKLIPDTEYKYIVRAYVDGKWTTMLKSDIVTVKTKAE